MKKLFTLFFILTLAFVFNACGGSSSSSAPGVTYTVTYDGNGCSSGSAPTDGANYTEGSTVVVASDAGTLFKPSYAVNSWNTEADGSGESYKAGDAFVMRSKNVTLYAIWDRWTRLTDIYTCGTKTIGNFRMAIDSSGNIFVTGYARDAYEYEQAFVIKYNPSGVKQWMHMLGISTSLTDGYGIAVDSSGNCYVAGSTQCDIDGDGSEVLTGAWDLFVAKYNTDGVLQWLIQRGLSGASTYGKDIALDATGNIYVTGYTTGALDMALDSTLTESAFSGIMDTFVIQFNSSCEFQWVKLLNSLNAIGTSSYYTFGYGIAVDPSGNSYIIGECTTSLSSTSERAKKGSFAAKYDANGNSIWVDGIGAGTVTIACGICVNSAGDYCYVTGRSAATTLNGQTTTNSTDAFVIQYSASDSTGTPVWTKFAGNNGGSVYGYEVACDSTGNIYLTGDTQMAMDEQSLPEGVSQSCYLVVFDSNGDKLLKDGNTRTRIFGGTSARGIVLDSEDNVYISGYLGSSTVFDGQTFMGSGSVNVFVTTRPND